MQSVQKSILRRHAHSIELHTILRQQVSSANNINAHNILFIMPSIYRRKIQGGPRIAPSGTPVYTGNSYKDQSLKTLEWH